MGIEYGGHAATASVCATAFPARRIHAIDDMVRAGCASVVHALTAGDSDNIRSAIARIATAFDYGAAAPHTTLGVPAAPNTARVHRQSVRQQRGTRHLQR